MSKKNEELKSPGTSRRELLRGAAVGAFGVASASLLNCGPATTTTVTDAGVDAVDAGTVTTDAGTTTCANWSSLEPSFMTAPSTPSNVKEEWNCDVLVIGCGVAGIPAARAAAEAGAKVLIIEKGADIGVLPVMSDFAVVNTKIHAAMTPPFSWAPKNVVVQEELKEMGWRPSQQMWNYWYEHSGETFDWLIEGADYQFTGENEAPTKTNSLHMKYYPIVDGFDPSKELYPYFHGSFKCVPSAMWPMKNSLDLALSKGASVKYSTWATQLIKDGSGRVIGAYARDASKNAYKINASKAVVLACGDIGGNAEMMKYYAPQGSDFMSLYGQLGKDAEGNAKNTGDGQQMGLWAGAQMERGPYAPMTHNLGGVLGADAFLLLNSEGIRYNNEDAAPQNLQNQLSRQPGGIAWQIVDANWKNQLLAQPVGHAYVNHYVPPDKVADYSVALNAALRGYVDDEQFLKGVTYSADSIEALAAKMGTPVAATVASISRYNELCAKGSDDDFGKLSKRMFKLDTGPYYAIKFSQTVMLVCMGGLVTNLDCQCLDSTGAVIPGLFACGNTQGGRFLGDYPVIVAGVSLGTAITFGRLAGQKCVL